MPDGDLILADHCDHKSDVYRVGSKLPGSAIGRGSKSMVGSWLAGSTKSNDMRQRELNNYSKPLVGFIDHSILALLPVATSPGSGTGFSFGSGHPLLLVALPLPTGSILHPTLLLSITGSAHPAA